MKNRFTVALGVIVALVLLAYMFCFQVRYDEVAVLTYFENATPPARTAEGALQRNADGSLVSPGSVCDKPGLYFRLPYPFNKVQYYSRRIQILEGQLQEFQTRDNFSVIIKIDLSWRIEDPNFFFLKLKDTTEARKQLQSFLSDVNGVIGRYNFEQLVNTDPSKLKLAEIEAEALAQIRKRLLNSEYGIAVESVGIRRLMLPERVTDSVFGRMKATRETLAANARATGKSQAQSIRDEAESNKKTILAFAERRASYIRAEGERKAAESYSQYAKDQDFAIFLFQIESLKKMLAYRTTFVLDATQIFSPLDRFNQDFNKSPEAAKRP